MQDIDATRLTGYVIVTLWWTLPGALAVVGVVGLCRKRRPRDEAGGVAGLAGCSILVLAGLWFLPVTQYMLNHPRQVAMLDAVLAFKGRPLVELEAELGPLSRNRYGVLTYDPSPWYAPLTFECVRLVEIEAGVLALAYIDD